MVCFTGGGTFGHILPALAVHEILKTEPGYQCFWIGRENNEERTAIENEDIEFFPIQSGKLRRYFSLRNLSDCFHLVVAFFQALAILAKKRPDVLFSKGGFVSVPPVFAARILGIPVVTHESDATPGLATKLIAPFARYICLGFAEAASGFAANKTIVTGNPIRGELLHEPLGSIRETLDIASDVPLLFIMGGSQGAQQINELVRENLDELCKRAFVYHQCGKRDFRAIKHANYFATEIVGKEMGSLYRESTVIVSRGGAGSICELAHFGCASILIPLPVKASRGDQVVNARKLEKTSAAIVLENDVTAKNFLEAVTDLLENGEKRSILSKNIKSYVIEGSADKIASVIKQTRT